MHELVLRVPDITWHSARDNIAEFANMLTMLTATLGKIAHGICEMKKNEFGEVEEAFEIGKVGSSTMPQKRNPMICEAILSVARLTRQSAAVAVDSLYSEHERDWSTVQMEWSYLPQLCVMAHGALEISVRVMNGLQEYPEKIMPNLP